MSEDTYKGESTGKKQARNLFWKTEVLLRAAHSAEISRKSLQLTKEVVAGLKRLSPGDLERFRRGLGARLEAKIAVTKASELPQNRLILASREGGDAAVLKAIGIPEENILAAEINREAAHEFAGRYPSVRLHRGNVSDVPAEWSFGSALLDFCSPLCFESIHECARILERLPGHGILGVGLLRGREHRSIRKEIAAGGNRFLRRAMRARAIPGLHPLDPARLVNYCGGGAWGRAAALSIALHTITGIRTGFRGMIRYHSRTAANAGVPMMIVILDRNEQGTDNIEIDCCCNGDAEVLKSAAIAEGAGEYNLEPRQVAAWRAHSTRGSYEREAT